jgi:glycosyltransferase involved in cell wall biosynthesis
MHHSKFHVTTPSKWMMDMVDKSIVSSSIIDARVIPNGVDTDTFCPGSQFDARNRLGLPLDSTILMTASFGLRHNVWKDYDTIRGAMTRLGKVWTGSRLQLLVVGEAGSEETVENATIRYVPYQKSMTVMADYYRAANLYLHAAKIESFGTTLIEARACGTPVVATAVGGIPEHVKSLQWSGLPSTLKNLSSTEATGVLVAPEDGETLASAVLELLGQPEIINVLRENGIRTVRENYSLRVQAQRFLDWFDEILSEDSRRAQS